MQRRMPHTSMTIHKHNTWQGNNMPCQTFSKVHVCNGQRRWFHGTADCVAACAHKAPRSQTRITSTMTERRHSRAKSKRRLGTASGTGLLWLAPRSRPLIPSLVPTVLDTLSSPGSQPGWRCALPNTPPGAKPLSAPPRTAPASQKSACAAA